MPVNKSLLIIPFVLGIGCGKLAAQGTAVVEKDQTEIIHYFSAPREVENQVNQDYKRILEILASISWDDPEDFYHKKDEIQWIQQKGAYSVAKINSPEKEDRLVDAYYKAINYRLYSKWNESLRIIDNALILNEYKDLVYPYKDLLTSFSSASRDVGKKPDIDWEEIEKLFKKADPNILKLTKYEIEETIKMMEQGGDEAFVSKSHGEKMDYMIYFIERTARLAKEQIDRLRKQEGEKDGDLLELMSAFMCGIWLSALLHLAIKSRNKKNKSLVPQQKKPFDDPSTLTEEEKQEKINAIKAKDDAIFRAVCEQFSFSSEMKEKLNEIKNNIHYGVDVFGEVYKLFIDIGVIRKDEDFSSLPDALYTKYVKNDSLKKHLHTIDDNRATTNVPRIDIKAYQDPAIIERDTKRRDTVYTNRIDKKDVLLRFIATKILGEKNDFTLHPSRSPNKDTKMVYQAYMALVGRVGFERFNKTDDSGGKGKALDDCFMEEKEGKQVFAENTYLLSVYDDLQAMVSVSTFKGNYSASLARTGVL